MMYNTVVEILRSTNLDKNKAMPRIAATVKQNDALLTALAHEYA